MNAWIILANILLCIVFVAHTWWGDKEIRMIEPSQSGGAHKDAWVMSRGAFHMVSVDFLVMLIAISLVNFTSILKGYESIILTLMTYYFAAYAAVFLFTLMLCKSYPGKFLRLPQWVILAVISGLLFMGVK
jgi:hypothetical protein